MPIQIVPDNLNASVMKNLVRISELMVDEISNQSSESAIQYTANSLRLLKIQHDLIQPLLNQFE